MVSIFCRTKMLIQHSLITSLHTGCARAAVAIAMMGKEHGFYGSWQTVINTGSYISSRQHLRASHPTRPVAQRQLRRVCRESGRRSQAELFWLEGRGTSSVCWSRRRDKGRQRWRGLLAERSQLDPGLQRWSGVRAIGSSWAPHSGALCKTTLSIIMQS